MSESAAVASPPLPELPALASIGEYTVFPLEYCTEDQAAELFTKICQRGNPVLKGRPEADLTLLGRAMFRKSSKLRVGQCVVHEGVPIALGFSWDAAEGGAWQDSGLEMPASLAAHAACGKAALDSLEQRGKTLFIGFYGVLPPHNGQLFGYLAVAGFMMGHALGFQDGYQYTLLPTLNKRAGSVFEEFGSEDQNKTWHFDFESIAANADEAVANELRAAPSVVTCSLTNLDFAVAEDSEWMARAAATVRMSSAAEIRGPAQLMATSHVEWLKSQ